MKIRILRNIFTILILSTILLSCDGNSNGENTPPENIEVSIIGRWKITQVIRQNSEGLSEDWTTSYEQVWVFNDSNTLTIDNREFEYLISDTQLFTPYSEQYNSHFFRIQDIQLESLILTASHKEEDKVGERTIYYKLIFIRLHD